MEPSVCSDPQRRRLLVAFDAVLNVHQLPEVRHAVADRVGAVHPGLSFECQLALQELCVAALERFGICAGLRVYDCGAAVRVEVDEPRPGMAGSPDSALGIVEALAQHCGVEGDGVGVRVGVDPRAGVSTAWCELDAAAH